jgi:hypothetical protein
MEPSLQNIMKFRFNIRSLCLLILEDDLKEEDMGDITHDENEK